MVDLRKKPYYLSDSDIAWVRDTIDAMTDEEKVGQATTKIAAPYSKLWCFLFFCSIKNYSPFKTLRVASDIDTSLTETVSR